MTSTVIIIRYAEQRFSARAVAWPEIVVMGESEEAALNQLRTTLADIQSRSYVREVDLALPTPSGPNPLLHFAGMWAHDPDWDAFQAAIQIYRAELDTSESST